MRSQFLHAVYKIRLVWTLWKELVCKIRQLYIDPDVICLQTQWGWLFGTKGREVFGLCAEQMWELRKPS